MRISLLFSVVCVVAFLLAVSACSSVAQNGAPDATTAATPAVEKDSAKTVSAAAPEGAQERGKISITWTTQREESCYGYYIYRADSEVGPFERLNKDVVPGAGTTTTPQDYKVVDQPLPMGKKYYYYVQEVDLDGRTRTITPIIGSVVHKPVDPEFRDKPLSVKN
jgi:hypothetical protein